MVHDSQDNFILVWCDRSWSMHRIFGIASLQVTKIYTHFVDVHNQFWLQQINLHASQHYASYKEYQGFPVSGWLKHK